MIAGLALSAFLFNDLWKFVVFVIRSVQVRIAHNGVICRIMQFNNTHILKFYMLEGAYERG